MQCYVEVLIRDGVVLSISCPDAECTSSGVVSMDEVNKFYCIKQWFSTFYVLWILLEILNTNDPLKDG